LQLTAIRHLVRGTSSSSLLFARRILLSIVLLYQQESFLYRYIDELVRALVSSIDQSQIITTPGQRQTVYETLNQIAELLLSGSLEKDGCEGSKCMMPCRCNCFIPRAIPYNGHEYFPEVQQKNLEDVRRHD
jgi:hypothetical protein